MSGASFDPFDLPGTFDPLAPVAPAPPRRRRPAAVAAAAAAPGPVAGDGAGAGGRLAHLLQPQAGEAGEAAEATVATDAEARIAALERQVATLATRLDGLESWLNAALGAMPLWPATGKGDLVDRRLANRGRPRGPSLPSSLR